MPGPVENTPSYEAELSSYSEDFYRAKVDNATYIFLGRFETSSFGKGPELLVSEVIKAPDTFQNSSRIHPKFENFNHSNITYEKPDPHYSFSKPPHSGDWVATRANYIFGQYGPADCSTWLDIYLQEDYIIFAKEDMTITSMEITGHRKEYVEEIRKLTEDSSIIHGTYFSLQELINLEVKILLLEASQCSPYPEMKILSSANYDDLGQTMIPKPIDVYPENFSKSYWELTDEDEKMARANGLKTGYFSNFPEAKHCVVGNRYISVGDVFWNNRKHQTGQIFQEKSGKFDFSDLYYQHHMSPVTMSIEEVTAQLSDKPSQYPERED